MPTTTLFPAPPPATQTAQRAAGNTGCLRWPNTRQKPCDLCRHVPATLHWPANETGFFCGDCCPCCAPAATAE